MIIEYKSELPHILPRFTRGDSKQNTIANHFAIPCDLNYYGPKCINIDTLWRFQILRKYMYSGN
jgi:hypothetical protein